MLVPLKSRVHKQCAFRHINCPSTCRHVIPCRHTRTRKHDCMCRHTKEYTDPENMYVFTHTIHDIYTTCTRHVSAYTSTSGRPIVQPRPLPCHVALYVSFRATWPDHVSTTSRKHSVRHGDMGLRNIAYVTHFGKNNTVLFRGTHFRAK